MIYFSGGDLFFGSSMALYSPAIRKDNLILELQSNVIQESFSIVWKLAFCFARDIVYITVHRVKLKIKFGVFLYSRIGYRVCFCHLRNN